MSLLTISAGDKPTAAQFNSFMTHTGGAWDTWTPTLTQGATPSMTINRAVYARAGRIIHFDVFLTVASGAGTATNNVVLGLPVAAAAAFNSFPLRFGAGAIVDATGPLMYDGQLVALSASTVGIKAVNTSPTALLGGSGFTAALAVGDTIAWSGTYEAAAG